LIFALSFPDQSSGWLTALHAAIREHGLWGGKPFGEAHHLSPRLSLTAGLTGLNRWSIALPHLDLSRHIHLWAQGDRLAIHADVALPQAIALLNAVPLKWVIVGSLLQSHPPRVKECVR